MGGLSGSEADAPGGQGLVTRPNKSDGYRSSLGFGSAAEGLDSSSARSSALRMESISSSSSAP